MLIALAYLDKIPEKICIYIYIYIYIYIKVKLKWSRYRPGVVQRVGRGIAVLFHDRCTRRGWVVSSTPRPQFTPWIDPVPILQEAGWSAGPVWTGGKSLTHRDSIPDRPALSESLYRLSYRAHVYIYKLPWRCLLLYMMYFKLPCVYCCSCLVCIVLVALCVLLLVDLCVLL